MAKNHISKFYKYIKNVSKNYLFFSLYLLSKPYLLKLPLNGVYLPQYIQYEWMDRFHIGTFIDIGASNGTISKAINHISPKTNIFAFEPIEEKGGLIKSKIKSKNLVVENLAFSNRVGSQEFYEYDYNPASSFLKPNTKNKKFTKQIIKKYPVQITTLDQYFKNKKLKKPIFIKMDTQGTENLIIKGGQKFLKQASLIIIEAAFVNTYDNQCLFDTVYDELTQLGFVYKGSMLDSHFYPIFGPLVQENAIFIKKGELSNYLQTEGLKIS